MFYETSEGRLQNLSLLQSIIITTNDSDETKFSIGYVQINGEVIKEGTYDTEELAKIAKDSIENSLLS